MTCLEKYMLEHPDSNGCFNNCPSTYGYMPDPEYCCKGSSFTKNCAKCWDREIPEEKTEESTLKAHKNPFAYLNQHTPGIKDSGDRTEFETGAVRDMREGKGRCDLMPLEVAKDLMADPRAKEMLENIRNFQKYNDADFLRLCLESFARCTGGCDNYQADVCTMLLEVAKHFEEGAKKYGENNWQKGIPVKCYIDSAVRHYLKWLRGDKDEPHDRAFVWNLMCCIWEVDYREKEEKCDG